MSGGWRIDVVDLAPRLDLLVSSLSRLEAAWFGR